MEYIDKDFESLLLNVRVYPLGTNLKKVFPILSKYEEFKGRPKGISWEKAFRYVVYAFDRESPLLAINDILERRFQAALLAGFETGEDGNFSVSVDKMVKGVDQVVNLMIIRYCIMQSSTDYSVLVTFEDSLAKELERLINFDPTDDDTMEKKKEIIDNISKLRTNINDLRKDLLNDGVDTFLAKSLVEFSESKKIDLSPEAYAKELRSWDHVSRYYREATNEKKI